MIYFKSLGKFYKEIYKSNEGKSVASFCRWGGCMGHRYVLQLLFGEKTKLLIIQQPLKLEKK
jgi:hypothetical protein